MKFLENLLLSFLFGIIILPGYTTDITINSETTWHYQSGAFDVQLSAVSLCSQIPGTEGGVNGIISRNDSISDINNKENDKPTSYILKQNYPNPFHSSTIISFEIPDSSFVSLRIYDILGIELEPLVNEIKEAGHYSYIWDGSEYPSGIYFYRLEANGFYDKKSMELMK